MPDIGLNQIADKDRRYRLLSIWDIDFLQCAYVILFFILIFTFAFVAFYRLGLLSHAVGLIVAILVFLSLFTFLVKVVIAFMKDCTYRLSVTRDIRKLSGDSYSKIMKEYDDPRLIAAYEILRRKSRDEKFDIAAGEIINRDLADKGQVENMRSLIVRGNASLHKKGFQSNAARFAEKLYLSDRFILLCSSNVGHKSFLIRLNEIEKILIYPKLADHAFRIVSKNENITKDEKIEPYEVTFWVNFLKDKAIPVEE